MNRWIDEQELSKIETSICWNNAEEEKSKPFWIKDGSFTACRECLRESGVRNQCSPEPTQGDHYYLPLDYKFIFDGMGYDLHNINLQHKGETKILAGTKPS